MGKDSGCCHKVTALLLSSPSISDLFQITDWPHFIHLIENEGRLPSSFMVSSNLERFLSLEVILEENGKKEERIVSSAFFPIFLFAEACLNVKLL